LLSDVRECVINFISVLMVGMILKPGNFRGNEFLKVIASSSSSI
jgi:hypothetical protein